MLAWRLSNTMIVNSDQGRQLTSFDVNQKLKVAGIRISMDGRAMAGQRLRRALKFECVYLHAWSGGREARDGIGHWMAFCNQQHPHAAHDGRTPDAVYYHQPDTMQPAEMAALYDHGEPDWQARSSSLRFQGRFPVIGGAALMSLSWLQLLKLGASGKPGAVQSARVAMVF